MCWLGIKLYVADNIPLGRGRREGGVQLGCGLLFV